MTAQSSVSHLLLRAAAAAPKLDASSERDLVERYHGGDYAALGQLIISNVKLATSRARALRGYGLAEDDLVQEGIVGLLEAASRFDIGQEVRFSTYAMWWIKATTMEFVLRNWSIVRNALSDDQSRLFFNLRRTKERLLRDPSADPASIRAAIASALGVPERDVDIMEARLGGDVSLNAPAPWDEDGEVEIGDSMADTSPLPDAIAFGIIETDDREIALRSAMNQLDDTERLVVQERWLTEDIAPLGALAEFPRHQRAPGQAYRDCCDRQAADGGGPTPSQACLGIAYSRRAYLTEAGSTLQSDRRCFVDPQCSSSTVDDLGRQHCHKEREQQGDAQCRGRVFVSHCGKRANCHLQAVDQVR